VLAEHGNSSNTKTCKTLHTILIQC